MFKIKAEYLIRRIFFRIEKISNKEDKTRFTKKKKITVTDFQVLHCLEVCFFMRFRIFLKLKSDMK